MPSPSPSADREVSCANGEVRRARPLLGTAVEIRVAARLPSAELHAAIDAAFAAIERIQRLMSFQDPESELSRLNQHALLREQRVDVETWTVLEAALGFAALGGGAFDPTVGGRLVDWGLLPRRAAAAVAPALWRDIELPGPGRVRFHRPLCLDLGGIAKGYAVDRACAVLMAAGADDVVVNAGGDLRVAGRWLQHVRLRHPDAPDQGAHVLRLRNCALATSAAYYSRRTDACGSPVSALVDPARGTPYLENGSASVQASECMSADALTKIVLFAPREVAERALAAYGAQAIVQPAAAVAAWRLSTLP